MLAFIVAVVAGFLTPHVESSIGKSVTQALSDHITVEPGESRLIAFLVVMLLAGIVIALIGGGSPFWVILGGAIGVFLSRLIDAGRSEYERRKAARD